MPQNRNLLIQLLRVWLLCLLCEWNAAVADGPVVHAAGSSSQIPVKVTRIIDSGQDRFIAPRIHCKTGNWCKTASPRALIVKSIEEDGDCVCQCPLEEPVYLDNVAACARTVPEENACTNLGFTGPSGEDASNPVVELPPYGQLIGWKVNTILPGQRCWIDESACRYLNVDGWNGLNDIRLGNQPPRFRAIPAGTVANSSDSTHLLNVQWLGSSEHADFLQGRLILLTLRCNATGLQTLNLCFPLRIAGTFGRLRSMPLMDGGQQRSQSEGDNVETGILVAAACGGALGVLYVIVLAMFIASRMRRKRLADGAKPRNPSVNGSACDEEDLHKRADLERDGGKALGTTVANSKSTDSSGYGSSYATWNEDSALREKLMLRSRGISSLAIRHLYTPPPFFLNDVLVVQTPAAKHREAQIQAVIRERLESKLLPRPPMRRRKIFFDPQFLEPVLLREPPREADIFRAQIHCMINITKNRLDKRRFLPHLESIVELSPEHSEYGFPLNDERDALKAALNAETRSLDAVVINLQRTETPELLPSRSSPEWSKVLDEEWGSNESIAKVSQRRKLFEVNSQTKSSTWKSNKENHAVRSNHLREGPRSDDEESDKASSRSGSNPEKDSGIEDDSSDKPSKNKTRTNAPVMISRKRILSANSQNTVVLSSKGPGLAKPHLNLSAAITNCVA